MRLVIYSYSEYRLAKMSSDSGRVAAAKPTNSTDLSETRDIVKDYRVMCKSEILDQSVNIEPFYGPETLLSAALTITSRGV